MGVSRARAKRVPCPNFPLDIDPRSVDNSVSYRGQRPLPFFSAILRKEEVVLMCNSGKPSAVALPPVG